MGRISAVLRAFVLASAVGLLAAGSAAASFDMTVTGGPSSMQAGAHPDLNLEIAATGSEYIKDLAIDLPAGFIGNPNAVTLCTLDQADGPSGCPQTAKVGETYLEATASIDPKLLFPDPTAQAILAVLFPQPIVVPLPIYADGGVYAMESRGEGDNREPARLWIKVTPYIKLDGILAQLNGGEKFYLQDGVQTLESTIAVRSPGDLGLRTLLGHAPDAPVPNQAHLGALTLLQKINKMRFTLYGKPPAGNGLPFTANPTTCGDKTVKLTANSYEGGHVVTETPNFTISGCDALKFEPTMSFEPGTLTAGQPGQVTAGAHFKSPAEIGDNLAEAHLKRAVFKMPVGAAVSASMASRGLAACTDEQFSYDTAKKPECPELSNIGTVKFDSPLVGIAAGHLFLATPTKDVPLRLFMYVKRGTIQIKLKASTLLDEKTGQVTMVFDGVEQPFTEFSIAFRGGPNGMLKAPDACGDYELTTDIEPFSGAVAHPTAPFKVDGCKPKSFAPTLKAEASPTTAAGDTMLVNEITRTDDDELITGMRVSLPAGLLAKLPGVTQCPVAKARVGDCGQESQIGTVTTDAGTGPEALTLQGPIYITEGYDGAIAGIAIVVDAKVPADKPAIDLGKVAIIGKFDVRPDLGIDIVATDVPKIVGGIPMYLKKIRLDLNKPGFTFNSSSCAPQEWKATMYGENGKQSLVTYPYQATGCENVTFDPQMSARLSGPATAPGIETRILGQVGHSTLRDVELTMPAAISASLAGVSRACAEATYNAGSCAADAEIGSVVAYSALLPLPVGGPVTLIKLDGEVMPALAMKLRGAISFDLVVRNRVVQETQNGVKVGLLRSTIAGVPDAPINQFDLKLNPNALLQSTAADICANSQVAKGVFAAHSGASSTKSVPVDTSEICGQSGQNPVAISGRLTGARKGASPKLTIKATAKTSWARFSSLRVGVQASRVKVVSKALRKAGRGTIGGTKKRLSWNGKTVGAKIGGAGARSVQISLGKGTLKRVSLKPGSKVKVTITYRLAGSGKTVKQTVRLTARR